MTRRGRATIAEALVDLQKVRDNLARMGVTLHHRRTPLTAAELVALVRQSDTSAAARHCGDTDRAPMLFLRRWMADRELSVAQPRQVPAFRPYRSSPGMRAAIDRCYEHAGCRSSSQEGFE